MIKDNQKRRFIVLVSTFGVMMVMMVVNSLMMFCLITRLSSATVMLNDVVDMLGNVSGRVVHLEKAVNRVEAREVLPVETADSIKKSNEAILRIESLLE